MNEKIRELAEQAGGFYASGFKEVGSEFCLVDDDIQKFAELIVGECMSLSDLPNSVCGQWDHLLPSEVISKHFGVK